MTPSSKRPFSLERDASTVVIVEAIAAPDFAASRFL
jgi:hypothetical protein